MTTRAFTITSPSADRNAVLVTWTGLLNGDDGAPVDLPDYADRSVQIGGTLGVGGSVTMEGSNDGSNYLALTDPQGNAVTKTAFAIETIEEVTRLVRPRVTAGDGSTSFSVYLWARRSR